MDKKYLDEIEELRATWDEIYLNLQSEGSEDFWFKLDEIERSKIIYAGITEGNRIQLETQKRAAKSLIKAEKIAWIALGVSLISWFASIISIATNF